MQYKHVCAAARVWAPLLSVVILLVGLGVSCSAAAQAHKIAVYVSATSNDIVGEQFVYQLREQLSASDQLSSVLTERDSFFQLKVVTLDPYGSTDAGAATSTVYSIVLTGQSFDNSGAQTYIDQWVGTCNVATVRSCAAGIVASADSDMAGIVSALKERLENQEH